MLRLSDFESRIFVKSLALSEINFQKYCPEVLHSVQCYDCRRYRAAVYAYQTNISIPNVD